MSLFALCLSLLFFTNETPVHKLVLKNGHTIQTMEPYSVVGRLVRFRDLRGTYLSLPKDMVDFEKTHRQQQAPPVPTNENKDAPLREIPWDHPHFRDKTLSIKEIIIDDHNLNHFSGHPESSPQKREPPDSEKMAEGTARKPQAQGKKPLF